MPSEYCWEPGDTPHVCTVPIFHLYSYRLPMPRPVALVRRAPRLQPCNAAGERLLLPVHLDSPWDLRSEGQFARAPLLWQPTQAECTVSLRVLGQRPQRAWGDAAAILPAGLLFGRRSQDTDGGLPSRTQVLRHTRFPAQSALGSCKSYPPTLASDLLDQNFTVTPVSNDRPAAGSGRNVGPG